MMIDDDILNILFAYDFYELIDVTDASNLTFIMFGHDNPRLISVNKYINDRNKSMGFFLNGVTTTCDNPNDVSLDISLNIILYIVKIYVVAKILF